MEETKVCNRCENKTPKPLSAFPRNPGCPDGHTNICKECTQRAERLRYAKKHGKAPRPEDAPAPKPKVKIPQRDDYATFGEWMRAMKAHKAHLFGGAKMTYSSKIRSGLKDRLTKQPVIQDEL